MWIFKAGGRDNAKWVGVANPKMSQIFTPNKGLKNGKFHANFTLLGRGAKNYS